jgi:hypoxanthine phosphoribosyltransferase
MTISAERPLQLKSQGMVFEPWIAHEVIDLRVAQIAGHLATRFDGQSVRLIPILRGAWEFSSMLVKKLEDIPHGPASIDVDPIRVKSYEGTDSRELRWLQRPEFAANPMVHDILVEDIADSARTLTAVEAYMREQGAASLTTAVLLDRPASRAEGIVYSPDLVGFEIDNPDAWAVGFGLDLNERYRGLLDIYGRLGPDGETPPPYHLPTLPEIIA